MRASILFGLVLLVAGLFTFTRGSAWHSGYMIAGTVLGLTGALFLGLLLTPKPSRGLKGNNQARKPTFTRVGRGRLARALANPTPRS